MLVGLWRAPKIMGARPHIMGARPHSERAPLNNGGAPSSCGRFGDFLLFFMQLRVDDFLDPLAVIQHLINEHIIIRQVREVPLPYNDVSTEMSS